MSQSRYVHRPSGGTEKEPGAVDDGARSCCGCCGQATYMASVCAGSSRPFTPAYVSRQ